MPIVRSTRRRDYDATVGQTVFTLDVPVFDLLDVQVFWRLTATETAWTRITTGFTLAFGPTSTVTVTFDVAPRPLAGSPARSVRVQSARVQERVTNATRGGAVQSLALETDLDRIATVLQETRRDIDERLTLDAAQGTYATISQLQSAQVAAGNVPAPGAGSIGYYLRALTATTWGWAALVAAAISDSTTAGRAILTAADAAAQRSAMAVPSSASPALTGAVSLTHTGNPEFYCRANGASGSADATVNIIALNELGIYSAYIQQWIATDGSAYGSFYASPAGSRSVGRTVTNAGWNSVGFTGNGSQLTGITQSQVANTRFVLTANRTYYVRTDGSDANTGLVNNAGGAFLTIQKALDVAGQFDMNNLTITIQIADGTYASGTVTFKAPVGRGNINLLGNTTTPANVIISTTGADCVSFGGQTQCSYSVKGVTTKVTSGSANVHYYIGDPTIYVAFDNVRQEAVSGTIFAHYLIRGGGRANILNETIAGGADAHYRADNHAGGLFTLVGGTKTLTGTPAFPTGFIVIAGSGCGCVGYSAGLTGAATGTRYAVSLNGVIETGGGGASYFPGSVAGTSATGGQYT